MTSLLASVKSLVQPRNQTGRGILPFAPFRCAIAPGIVRSIEMASLQELLSARPHDAAPELVELLDRGRLSCHACGHRCPIPDGALGVCKVRYNEGGRLRVPWGYVAGVQCDPVEKKPFFHAY